MKTCLFMPRKYVQGRGVLGELGAYLAPLGKRPMLIWDERVKGAVGAAVLAGVRAAGLEPVEALFRGESTKAEAERLTGIARKSGADISVGIGGGKSLDVAKAAAVWAGIKMVTVPTIASNDSPTSAASVWYDDAGNCIGWDCWPQNPDLVLVDTGVIAAAPVRPFVAGMGDALSTWVEAEASYKTRAKTLAGGAPTMAAITLARLCFDTLLEHGVAAKRAIELHAVTPAVEKCVEANVLLSGLGFESGGLATAHMIGNSLTMFGECHGFMHGEKVAFGVVTQLCLDDETGTEEVHRIVDFEVAVGLPVTFAELNLDKVGRDKLKSLADVCAGEGSLCKNHPFRVTPEDVLDAMFAADALGRERKAAAGGIS